VDGELQHASLAKPVVTPRIELGLGSPVEVISFQQAPDQVAGIMEVVVRAPRELFGDEPVVALPIVFVLNDVPLFTSVIHSVYVSR
jgi:hypothetical protein